MKVDFFFCILKFIFDDFFAPSHFKLNGNRMAVCSCSNFYFMAEKRGQGHGSRFKSQQFFSIFSFFFFLLCHICSLALLIKFHLCFRNIHVYSYGRWWSGRRTNFSKWKSFDFDLGSKIKKAAFWQKLLNVFSCGKDAICWCSTIYERDFVVAVLEELENCSYSFFLFAFGEIWKEKIDF